MFQVQNFDIDIGKYKNYKDPVIKSETFSCIQFYARESSSRTTGTKALVLLLFIFNKAYSIKR